MRKRLRKKESLCEFRQFGAKLSGKLRSGTDFERFLDDFIENAIEANGLQFGGGGIGTELDGFVELGRADYWPENLRRVQAWLAQHPSVETFRFSEVRDANSISWATVE